jgi:hypothetical protein
MEINGLKPWGLDQGLADSSLTVLATADPGRFYPPDFSAVNPDFEIGTPPFKSLVACIVIDHFFQALGAQYLCVYCTEGSIAPRVSN